jgi:hypothetical protein
LEGLVVLGLQKNADLIIEATQLEEFRIQIRMFYKTVLTACALQEVEMLQNIKS